MSDSTRDPEGVYTFGEFVERFWTVFMLWADLFMGLYEDMKKSLKGLREEIDLRWLEEAERMREELREQDRKYHAAA